MIDTILLIVAAAGVLFGFHQWRQNRHNAMMMKTFLIGLRASAAATPIRTAIDDMIASIEIHSFPILVESLFG
jgi:hypothetical protein